MKTKIMLNELIVESAFTPEEILKVNKYAPEVLCEKDENGDYEFIYAYKSKAGAIAPFGIFFNRTNAEGKAVLKVALPECETPEELKAVAADLYGSAILRGKYIEELMVPALENISAKVEEVINEITIIA